jgi:hypothetical protein
MPLATRSRAQMSWGEATPAGSRGPARDDATLAGSRGREATGLDVRAVQVALLMLQLERAVHCDIAGYHLRYAA